MSAPEKLYLLTRKSDGEWSNVSQRIVPDWLSKHVDEHQYIRADIHEAEIDALKAELTLAKELLERWYNDSDIPDSNCSCHINPPCGDCINWGGLRETANETEKLLGVK